MKYTALLLATLLFLSNTAYAKKSLVELKWSQLKPNLPSFEDPFKALSKSQLDDLGYYVGLKNDIAQIEQRLPNSDKLPLRKAELTTLANELIKQGVDIDYLLSQREKITQFRQKEATAVNKQMLNLSVQISGYVIPITGSNNGVTEFFLVKDNPFLNIAHDHSVPAPNQVIYLKSPEGIIIDFKQSVFISGKLNKHNKQTTIKMPDGHEVTIESSYEISMKEMTQS